MITREDAERWLAERSSAVPADRRAQIDRYNASPNLSSEDHVWFPGAIEPVDRERALDLIEAHLILDRPPSVVSTTEAWVTLARRLQDLDERLRRLEQ